MRRVLLAGLAAVLWCLLAAPGARAAAATGAPAVPGDLTAAEVTFRGDGGLVMHGTVLSPAHGGGGKRPGIVLIHGAGTGTPRTKLMGEAVEFARRGLSVLVYDKRSVGYSLFERSYAQLAGDALGAVAALRRQPGVDPAKVGVWGLSEGGWVAPMAAARSRDVAFVVLVGANSQQPLLQQAWAVHAGLRAAGVRGRLVDGTEPDLYRVLADGELFPEPYYDPAPTIAAVRCPVLAVWGVHDLLTPARESGAGFAEALRRGGNEHLTVRYFADADHAAHLTPDRGVTRLPELAPGYADLVGSWVTDVTSGRPPASGASGPEPVQATPTVPVPPVEWWEAADVQAGALVVMLAGFAAYPLGALVRRVRARSAPAGAGVSRRPVSAAARLLSAGGLTVVLGSFGYVMYAVMTGAKLGSPGPLVAGRPVVWLALQALAVACVVATAVTGLAWWRRRAGVAAGERVRLAALMAGGLVLVPWGLYWGLLLPGL
ncbi:alpha/beta hydrolase family protein [Nonomuraea rhodomycinica]|uniref:Prolyl oligopeptidase family serine peptidase n=1 Tax=Nonomuraea rhodomycinica TaxID=1712872 RepID=A0A7Y6IW36_9ACTN|nr:prolyl oligopeptidase family serine peptidase [Nonomuraea rhodomycinica]NUW44903.1 prolyl oligopeptidase family serine peptidase [Nonomuraea rhodomycinica]